MAEEAGARSYGEILKDRISGKAFKNLIAAKVRSGDEWSLKDLALTAANNAEEIEPVYADSPEGEEILRHSAAHVMASAVKKLFPEAKIAIGPAIEKGFYYDFDPEKPFSPSDLELIEKEMAKILDGFVN